MQPQLGAATSRATAERAADAVLAAVKRGLRGGQGRVAGGEGSVGGGGAPGTVWFKSEYENPSDDSGDEDRALEGGYRAAGSERSARHAVVSGSTGCAERAWLTPLPE